MYRTPSPLKWLAEKRARVSSYLIRNTARAAYLEKKIKMLQRHLDRSNSLVHTYATELSALDRVILQYDARLKPALIEPIHGTKGKYGEHGALRKSIIQLLSEESPSWVRQQMISDALKARFNIPVATPRDRLAFRYSVKSTLRILRLGNVVERGERTGTGWMASVSWRLHRPALPTLDQLRR